MRWKHAVLVLFAGMAVAVQAYAADGPPRVMVLPFEEISANPSQGWIGQAISQSIVAELSQLRTIEPAAGDRQTSVVDRARAAAEAGGADYVVLGGYQLLDPQLRITGQVIAVDSGEVIGGLKATGTVRDLFGMQDSLAAQTKRILRAAVEAAPADATSSPPASTDQPPSEYRPVESSGPIRISTYEGSTLQQAVRSGGIYQAQPTAYNLPRYDNYAYGYGYAWPYPGGYYGLPIYWGYPPPISSGYWPVVPGYRLWLPGRVIIKKVHSDQSSIHVRVTK